jgi:GNAT superfamily N-acetyltransferase
MSSHQLSIFTRDHLDQATVLSQAEHWPHRREDWDMLLGLSAGSVALRDGAVVGTSLRTDYGPDVSMINMIIVGQSERGLGLGRKLMQAVMRDDSNRELRLAATQEGLPLYEKLGFLGEDEITQCQGNVDALSVPESEVFPASAEDVDAIIQLDSQYFAADRGALLRWLAQNGKLATTRSGDGVVTGYAALYRFGRGQVIGPILAPTAEQAQDLIRHFAAPLRGEFIRIDTDNTLGLVPWLEGIGLTRAGGGVKMRKNARTHPRPAFGLYSHALG